MAEFLLRSGHLRMQGLKSAFRWTFKILRQKRCVFRVVIDAMGHDEIVDAPAGQTTLGRFCKTGPDLL